VSVGFGYGRAASESALLCFLPQIRRMLTLQHVAALVEANALAAQAQVREFDIGGRFFKFNSGPAVMGVINLSIDSWYRESVCPSVDHALERGKVLAAQGADIVDIGAESTLAHAAVIDAKGQTSKLLPVIAGLRRTGILVSVETYLPEVASACLHAGANVLNLTGTEAAEEVYALACKHQAAVIICYVQGSNVRTVDDFDLGADPIELMYDYFARQVESATRTGLKRIFIDPGLGFYYRNLQDSAARVQHQMKVFLGTFRLRTLGFPVCHALPHALDYFGEEVRSAEPFFAVLAALGKTDLFRTHEVPKTRAVLRTLQLYT
jgi:dihydropteroate synthase